jgi:hypothetical protein
MIYHRAGIWTQQEINDFEDCIGMWRFEKKGNRIFVKYPRKETSMTDKEAMPENNSGKPIAWYDPSNGVVSTDRDSPLFTPLGQVWPLSPKGEWVDLTDTQIENVYFDVVKEHRGAPMPWGQVQFGKALLKKFKEVNT